MANPGLVWPLMLAGLGWLLLAWGTRGDEPLALCIGLDLPSFGRFRTNLDAMVFYADPLAILIEWMAMVAAMMLPLAAVGLGRLAMRSHRPQRPGLLLAAISGYLAVWILIGPLVVLAVFVLRAWAATAPDALWPVMAPFALAALWTLSPLRRRVLIAAHRVPLLFGSPTVQRLGAARYGGALGIRCAIVCLPVMAAPMVAGQGLVAMLLTSHVLLGERLAHEPRGATLWPAVVLLAGLAAVQAV